MRAPILAVAGLVSLSSSAFAADVTPTWICRNGKLERRITVEYEKAGAKVPCAVHYQKEGQADAQAVATAQAQEGYCESRAEALAEKLNGLGWTCEIDRGGAPAASAPADKAADQPSAKPSAAAQ